MNKRGILHKLMLVVILVAGFGLALTLPAYKRHQDRQHARHAVLVLQQLIGQEQSYFAQHGFYTADLASLLAKTDCTSIVEQGQSTLRCPGYEIALEEAHLLLARSMKYPQWFMSDIEQGSVSCEYEVDSPVGAKLCAQVPF